jgi:hypothetical protein
VKEAGKRHEGDLGNKKIGAEVFGECEMWCWRRMEKIKWSEKVSNEQVLERIRGKRTLLNNILLRTANWIGQKKLSSS